MDTGANREGYPLVTVNVYVAAATVSGYVGVLSQDSDLELIEAKANYDVTSTSGVAKLYNCAAGDAPAGGVALLTTAGIDLAGTARTPVSGVLATTTSARRVPKGNSLGLGISGTMTNLVGGVITLTFKRVN